MADGNEHLDTRDIAVIALTKIEGHEKTCAERYGNIVKIGLAIVGSIAFLILTKLADFFQIVTTHH